MTKFLSYLKHIIKVILRKDIHVKKEINLRTNWYGQKYLGFFVYDKYINSSSIVYSFGVGEDISFDIALINKFNCTVFGFDPTPKSIEFIKRIKPSPNFVFSPIGIYKFDGIVKFYLPSNPEHVSCSTSNVWNNKSSKANSIDVPVKMFSTILKELQHKEIDILKLDIEGSEYQALNDILNSKCIIKQILIEFHHRFPTIGIKQTKKAINKLTEAGYKLAAVSVNYEEFTFVNSKLINS
ncbi:FkbM family methyltransferase [uncultured Draconibacterium sp.]|uniref:FkbM family methyltransferase n=1 Tax=uncultured Draconibacterium sp. TaxID=1573823 RepID=UPI003216B8BF